ncbi:hypothetical protein NDU88_004342 [Pleurodeles waltl]|uniref:DDE Tnp4 domain-containing protein n=1 Tax=Pleurodeles waltl TaxID=8319 RepID=A0AAV7L180_PLEWA|nr:hypothetical protein NDU88_004342 [Pleurodeles waltl]
MAVTSAEVTSAAVSTVTTGVHRHWLLGPIGSNVNQYSIAPRSSTAYRNGVQRQRSYLTSHCPTLQAPSAGTCEEMVASSGVPTIGGPVDNGGATFDSHLQVEDLPTVKGDFYALGHIPNIIGAIDGTHVALVPAHRSEQVYRNWKSYHSMNVQMVCLADQYISHVNAMFPGSVHDAYILRNSSIPYVMGQLQSHHVWLLGDSGYPNLSWLLTPVRNPRTRTEERYNEAQGRTRRVIEQTFGLLKARFRCLHMTSGSLFYSPKKVCQIIVAYCMLHNLALQRQVPFLQEDGPDDGVVAAVEPVNSDEEEAEEEDMHNRDSVIQQYFQ